MCELIPQVKTFYLLWRLSKYEFPSHGFRYYLFVIFADAGVFNGHSFREAIIRRSTVLPTVVQSASLLAPSRAVAGHPFGEMRPGAPVDLSDRKGRARLCFLTILQAKRVSRCPLVAYFHAQDLSKFSAEQERPRANQPAKKSARPKTGKTGKTRAAQTPANRENKARRRTSG